MEKYLHIVWQGTYFTVFYNLSFIVMLGILLYEGHKRRFPMMRWILLLGFSWMAFVAGSKLITLSAAEWQLFLKDLSLPLVTKKNLLGGLIAGTLALFAGKHLFRFKQDFADAFAYVLPLGVAIQRIGCFFNGCCHGTFTTVPFAVRYSEGSIAHFHHYENGLITGQDLFSLPVHPVQLYEIAGCLIVILLLFRLRRYLKAKGSLMLTSLILFSLQHFFVEFFRDPVAHTGFFRATGTLGQLQWFILILIIVLSLILFRREMKFSGVIYHQPQSDMKLSFSAIIIFFNIVILWTLRDWFTFSEVLTLTLLVTLAAGWQFAGMLRNFIAFPVYRFVPVLMLLQIVIMAQTIPGSEADSSLIRHFKTISIGTAAGDFFNTHSIGHGEGCERTSETEYFRQKYILGGAGYSVTNENIAKGTSTAFGLNAIIGQHRETRLSDNYSDTEVMWGLTPFFSYDRKWFGLGIGLHLGNLSIITENLDKEGNPVTPETGTLKTNMYPKGYLRIGPQKWAFADIRVADQFPSALPGFRYQIGIGSGLGQSNNVRLRMGLAGPHNEKGGWFSGFDVNGAYLTGYFPIKDKYVFEPLVMYNIQPDETETIKTNNGFQISLGLGYRFGHEMRNR